MCSILPMRLYKAWTAPERKNATSHLGILPFAVIRRRAAPVFGVSADDVSLLASVKNYEEMFLRL
jgi:hypothetical protein